MFWVLSWIATGLSKLSDQGLHRLAHGLAFVSHRVLRLRRRVIAKNLKIAFGDQATPDFVDQMGFSAFYSLILTVLEFLESHRVDLGGTVKLRGLEHIDRALAEGAGAYIMCLHMANWEALAAAVCGQVRTAYVPVKEVGGEGVNGFVTHLRTKYKLHTAKRRQKGDSFEIIKQTLARKEIVGFMMDQARPGSPRLPFFGTPAKTNTSLSGIWHKLPVPIVPIIPRRLSPRHHEIEFFPAIQLPLTGDLEADVLAHSQLFNEITESLIRKNPSQYLWLHDRWK